MLDTSRVVARLEVVRTFADGLGLRVQFESRLAYLARYAAPRSTRCTLYPDFEEHAFRFTMETESPDDRWSLWFEGRVTPHVPHDVRSPGAFPKFAVVVTPPLGWSISPDPVGGARAFYKGFFEQRGRA